jgi:hypothetical protein
MKTSKSHWRDMQHETGESRLTINDKERRKDVGRSTHVLFQRNFPDICQHGLRKTTTNLV